MATFLRREADAFLFRRRVPERLQARLGQRELYRSLGTTVRREAKQRAATLYIGSERLFAMADDFEITDEDIRAAVRYWMSYDRWQRAFQYVDQLPPAELRAGAPDLPGQMIDGGWEQIMPSAAVRDDEASAALEAAGYPWPFSREILARTVDVMLEHLRGYVDRRMQEVFRPETLPSASGGQVATANAPDVPKPQAPSPKIGNPRNLEDWLKWAQTTSRERVGVTAQTVLQSRVAVRLFVEIMGDRRVREITHEDAAQFRQQLLRMPALHGKGREVNALTAIAQAGDGARLLSMKTVKRHFSALNNYWQWLIGQKYVNGDVSSPFRGHSFPGTKSKKSSRDDWSSEDLERLLKSVDYRSAGRDSALHWLPLIALHSGMRLEEICRLRPVDDIVQVDGFMCFHVQAHPDGWDPKTEAGTRYIPVHSWLIEHGFMALLDRRRMSNSDRVFPDLRPSGPDQKLGAEFGREFSRLKQGLGFGSKTVFHSFRHTFRTVLESTDFKESHIDAVMGHEGGGGEGRTYTKRVAISKLSEVVEGFKSPLVLDFVTAGVDVPVRDWKPRIKKVKLTPRVPRQTKPK